MQCPAAKSDYERAKREAKERYLKIGEVWCPALNDSVAFRRPGFMHLAWKGSRQRPKKEQMRRFALLPHAENMLQNMRPDVTHRNRGNIHFWAFSDERDGRTIRLIVRQIRNKKKHFFSIFEVKQKATQ